MSLFFRPLQMQDVPLIWDIYSEPTIQHQAVLHVEEMTADSIEPMLHRWLTDGRQFHFLVTDETGTPLGLNQLFAVDRIRRTGEAGVYCCHMHGDEASWRRSTSISCSSPATCLASTR